MTTCMWLLQFQMFEHVGVRPLCVAVACVNGLFHVIAPGMKLITQVICTSLSSLVKAQKLHRGLTPTAERCVHMEKL